MSKNELQFRVKVDFGIIENIREELDRTERELVDNRTPMSPTRRNTMLAVLDLMQGPNAV